VLNLSCPDIDRRWSLPNIVFVTYSLFLAGFYFIPNAVDHYKFYIAAVFFPGLFLLPRALKLSNGSLIWRSLLLYLGYMLLSSLWSDNFSLAALWRDIRYAAYLLSFILLTLYLFERNQQLPVAIMQGVALLVGLAATFSVANFKNVALLPTLTDERLVGLGTIDNPNPSAFIYGFFSIVALNFARRHQAETLAYVYVAAFFVIVLYVILTQSNTALLAMTLACALLYFVDQRHAKITLRAQLIGLVLSFAAATYLAWSLGLMNKGIDIGFMNRLPVWRYVLEQWHTAPVVGHGFQRMILLADDGKPSILNYAHSLFFSTLRDGGLVGLLLLLAVYFHALRSAIKMAAREHSALFLCLFMFGLICVLVDTDQIITRPRELWIILWLPLACLVAYEVGLIGKSRLDSLVIQSGDSPKNIR
jgi:O-Antigen ligase